MKELSVLNASLMAGEGIINGFTEEMKKCFSGGYSTINPGVKDFNSKIVALCEKMAPDIVFLQIQTPGIITVETAKKLAEKSFVINFSGDIRCATEQWYFDVGKEIQLSTFSNMRDVEECRKRGIAADFLQIGYNPDIYRPIRLEADLLAERKDSIVAMFNNYGNQFPLGPERERVVNALLKRYPTEFSVYGSGWGYRASGELNSSQHAEAHKYNQACIALSISHFLEPRYFSDRLLRSVGSGTFTLTHRYPGLELDWIDGQHLVAFNDLPDLINKIDYYLENVAEREQIARVGELHARKNFTFECMANNIKSLFYKHHLGIKLINE
jgi:glycosyltransferase involved in cell wall biosynthesis